MSFEEFIYYKQEYFNNLLHQKEKGRFTPNNKNVPKMMIVQKRERFTIQKLEKKIFNGFSQMTERTFQQLNLNIGVFVFEVILLCILEVGLLFRSELSAIWNCPQIAAISGILSFTTPQGFISNPSLFGSIVICASVINIANFISLCYLTVQETPKRAFLLFIACFFRVSKMLMRPLLQFAIFNTFYSSDSIQVSSRAISAFSLLCLITAMLIYSRIYFNPLPKSNPFYQLDTDYEAYSCLNLFIKILLLCVFPFKKKLLLCLFILEIVKECSLKQQISSPLIKMCIRLPSQVYIVTLAFALMNHLVPAPRPLFYFWIMTLITLFIYKRMQLNMNKIGNMEMEDCEGNDRTSICFFLKQRWAIEHLQQSLQLRSYFGFFANHVKKCRLKTCPILQNQKTTFSYLQKKDIAHINKQINQYVMFILKENSRDDDLLATCLFVEHYKHRSMKNIENFNRSTNQFYQRYLRFHLHRILQKDLGNGDYFVTEENFTQTKLAFLKQLQSTSSQLLMFFEELNSKKARLTILEELGTHCFDQVQELKKLFLRLLDNKMDLTIVGFYLEFIENLMGNKILAQQLIGKINKKMTLQKYEDNTIEESPQPTLEIDMTNGKLIDINMEAIKLVGYMKGELIDKPVGQFLRPEVQEQDWQFTFEQLKDSQLICFCENRQGSITVARIKSRVKDFANKKKYYLVLTPLKFVTGKISALIGNDMSIVSVSSPNLVVNEEEILPFEGLFRSQIEPSWQQLVRNHNIKIQCGEQASAAVSLYETINSTVDCIYVELLQSCAKALAEPEKIYKQNIKFSLVKDLNDNVIYLGDHTAKNLQLSKKAPTQEVLANMLIQQIFFTVRTNYSEGIKSYRLCGERIYNDELQQQNFNQLHADQNQNKQTQWGFAKKFHQMGLWKGLLYGVLLLLLTLIIYKNILYYNKLQQTHQMYKAYILIEMFELKFYWIACILRDIDLGLVQFTHQWTDQVGRLLKEIQVSQTVKFFSSKNHIIEFLGVNYNMGLDEIYSMILSFMLTMVKDGSTLISEDIHQTIAGRLSTWTIEEKAQISNRINESLHQLNLYSWSIFGIICALLIIFLGLLVLIDLNEIKQRSGMLTKFLLMSDHDISLFTRRLTNFQNLLSLQQKGVETQVFKTLDLDENQQINLRPVPKDLLVPLMERKTVLALLFVILCLGVGIFTSNVMEGKQKNTVMLNSFDMNRALSQSYIYYLYLTIHAQHGVDQTILRQTFDSLQKIQFQTGILPFSSSFNNFVDHIYYADSCDLVSELTPGIDCDNFSPQTLFSNPFKYGFAFYYHHVYFSIRDKFDETVPSTGFSAKPFMLIVEKMINLTEDQWQLSILDAIQTEYKFLAINLLLWLVCFFTLWGFLKEHAYKRVQIQNICTLVELPVHQKDEQESQQLEILDVKKRSSHKITEDQIIESI